MLEGLWLRMNSLWYEQRENEEDETLKIDGLREAIRVSIFCLPVKLLKDRCSWKVHSGCDKKEKIVKKR